MRIWPIIVTITALLAACTTASPYRPAGENSRYGFSEQRIESDRYAISFRGDSRTEREEVETFLLYRAAEFTLEQGFDHFILVRRDTDEDSRRVSTDPFGGSLFMHRYYHPRYGWYYWRDPFWDDQNFRDVTRYEATAEVLMGSGPAPNDPDAYDAIQVVDNLGPRVRATNETG